MAAEKQGVRKYIEDQQRLINHKKAVHVAKIDALWDLCPGTEIYQAKISDFQLQHPELAGMDYASLELLMNEANQRIQSAAIEKIITILERKRDVKSESFSIGRINVSSNQTRKILQELRREEIPGKLIQKRYKRKKEKGGVVSFRTTNSIEDAISHLAVKCGVSKSAIVDALIEIHHKHLVASKQM